MPEEMNIVEEVTETETKKKVDLDGAVGAGALVGAGVVLGKLVSWGYKKAKPKVQEFAGKVAGASKDGDASDGAESEPDVDAE